MDIIYEYVNVSASERLEQLVSEKLAKLKERYNFVIRADVFFKLENVDIGERKHCGIRLSLNGPRLYASSNEGDFESAIRETVRDLNDQLEKKKGKM